MTKNENFNSLVSNFVRLFFQTFIIFEIKMLRKNAINLHMFFYPEDFEDFKPEKGHSYMPWVCQLEKHTYILLIMTGSIQLGMQLLLQR